MKITKLEYQKKDPQCVNVFVDEKFAVGLDVNDLIRLGLYKDQEIDQGQLNKIIGESEFGKKLNAALNFLSFRPRSEFELRQYFRRKKFGDIEPLIEKLRALGQISDEEFARWYIDQRRTFRPRGRRAVAMELRRKGIASNIIKQLLSNSNSTEELSLAKKALVKYRGKGTREKMARFLVGRGFDWDTVRATVEKILKSEYNSGE